MSHRVHLTVRRMIAVGALLTAFTATNLVARVPAASAAPTVVTATAARAAARPVTVSAALVRGYRLVSVAKAQAGKPYRFGARGPRAFDCSGLTGYVYSRALRISLPRTAQQQYRRAHRIAKAAARPGDLVFWVRGGRAYHVAIYAGGGRVWHAPHAGQRVRLAQIWSATEVRYGRIGR